MKWKIMGFLLCLIGMFGCMGAFAADTPVDIQINGQKIKCDTEIVSKNGRVYAPVRFLSQAVSFDVGWNEGTQKVTLSSPEICAELTVGSSVARVNGEKLSLVAPAWIYQNRTYLPVRSVAEIFGAKVGWNDMTRSVLISMPDTEVDATSVDNRYSGEDLEWLAKIVHAEAQGEQHKGKVAVANVVLNRVKSKEFPNTIYGVIFDRKYGVQFTPIANGAIYNNPSRDCYGAAKQALYGYQPVGESLYFFNAKIATSSWIAQNRPYHMTIGNHAFYL
ncbi:MAG: copper amine oxidase [Ruminococcaceae bacterium]|nr:copper amine oxidase [Oscillospiraceae bacterium]